MSSTDKQSQLNEIIVELSKKSYNDAEIKQTICIKLNDIYRENFRHSYSQIFATIEKEILSDNNCSLEFLSMNFNTLYSVVSGDSTVFSDEVRTKFNKLFDHVMLEVARIGYLNSNQSKQEHIEQELQKLDRKISNGLGELKTSTLKMDSLRTESVTVLSILAAIMLAGMGGFTILGNIAGAAKDISNYRFFVITAFLGIILFNVVFMLIYMIARLTDKNIYTICTDNRKISGSDCATANGCSNNCWGLTRIRKRMPYLYWFNLLCIGVIVISLLVEHVVMKYHWLEWLSIVGGIFLLQVALYCGGKNK